MKKDVSKAIYALENKMTTCTVVGYVNKARYEHIFLPIYPLTIQCQFISGNHTHKISYRFFLIMSWTNLVRNIFLLKHDIIKNKCTIVLTVTTTFSTKSFRFEYKRDTPIRALIIFDIQF